MPSASMIRFISPAENSTLPFILSDMADWDRSICRARSFCVHPKSISRFFRLRYRNLFCCKTYVGAPPFARVWVIPLGVAEIKVSFLIKNSPFKIIDYCFVNTTVFCSSNRCY